VKRASPEGDEGRNVAALEGPDAQQGRLATRLSV